MNCTFRYGLFIVLASVLSSTCHMLLAHPPKTPRLHDSVIPAWRMNSPLLPGKKYSVREVPPIGEAKGKCVSNEMQVSKEDSVVYKSSLFPPADSPIHSRLATGDLLVFCSTSWIGRMVISITSLTESFDMGHAAMVIKNENPSGTEIEDDEKVLLVTAEEKGACVRTLKEIMSDYQREYRDVWVIPMVHMQMDEWQLEEAVSQSLYQEGATSGYSLLGVVAGLCKMKSGVSIPLPDSCLEEGKKVFCTQAIVRVLQGVSLLRSDLADYEVATSFMPYLFNLKNHYLFSNKAFHLSKLFSKYYPDYNGRHIVWARAGSEDEILQKTYLANTRSDSFVRVLIYYRRVGDGRYPEIIHKLSDHHFSLNKDKRAQSELDALPSRYHQPTPKLRRNSAGLSTQRRSGTLPRSHRFRFEQSTSTQ